MREQDRFEYFGLLKKDWDNLTSDTRSDISTLAVQLVSALNTYCLPTGDYQFSCLNIDFWFELRRNLKGRDMSIYAFKNLPFPPFKGKPHELLSSMDVIARGLIAAGLGSDINSISNMFTKACQELRYCGLNSTLNYVLLCLWIISVGQSNIEDVTAITGEALNIAVSQSDNKNEVIDWVALKEAAVKLAPFTTNINERLGLFKETCELMEGLQESDLIQIACGNLIMDESLDNKIIEKAFCRNILRDPEKYTECVIIERCAYEIDSFSRSSKRSSSIKPNEFMVGAITAPGSQLKFSSGNSRFNVLQHLAGPSEYCFRSRLGQRCGTMFCGNKKHEIDMKGLKSGYISRKALLKVQIYKLFGNRGDNPFNIVDSWHSEVQKHSLDSDSYTNLILEKKKDLYKPSSDGASKGSNWVPPDTNLEDAKSCYKGRNYSAFEGLNDDEISERIGKMAPHTSWIVAAPDNATNKQKSKIRNRLRRTLENTEDDPLNRFPIGYLKGIDNTVEKLQTRFATQVVDGKKVRLNCDTEWLTAVKHELKIEEDKPVVHPKKDKKGEGKGGKKGGKGDKGGKGGEKGRKNDWNYGGGNNSYGGGNAASSSSGKNKGKGDWWEDENKNWWKWSNDKYVLQPKKPSTTPAPKQAAKPTPKKGKGKDGIGPGPEIV